MESRKIQTAVLWILVLCAIGIAGLYWRQSDRKEAAGLPAMSQNLSIRSWHYVDGFEEPLAQFDTVFWEPDDTTSLRKWLSAPKLASTDDLLEIGTGTGLVALHSLREGVTRVVATDINPQACANARFNADNLGLSERLEVRLVPDSKPGPFSVIDPTERFDLIVSNPPWESAPVEEVAAYALYDPDFGLLDAMLAEAQRHLKADGQLLLAYGAKSAIERIKVRAPQAGWQITIDDPRDLDKLPEVFLPGMLLQLSPLSVP